MGVDLYRRPYKIRRAAKRGKEITIAPEADFEPGDLVIQLFNSFVLLVPQGTKIDEESLRQAITLPPKE